MPATPSFAPVYQGGCLCGAVRYRLHATPKAVTHCHCSMCQKAHGAAFASYGAVPHACFELLQGQAQRRSYRSSADVDRSFCGECGSPLTWQRNTGDFSDWICVALGTLGTLGTLDTPFAPSKQRHVHQASAPAWSPLTQGGCGEPALCTAE